MTPTTFPQANALIKPPDGFLESQVQSIPAYQGKIAGGCFDGALVSVVAWQPSPDERERMSQGAPVFITFLGGVLPHTVTSKFPLICE